LKVLQNRKKNAEDEDFHEAAEEGDEFMAIKPWLGAIK
jgi:hypothetical protein